MEDNEIIELYWNRSQQAIVETSIKYGKQLHTLAERILYNHEDSEECVNDTYHIAWNTLPPKRPDYFFAYLAKITRNFCFGKLDYQKARSVMPKLLPLVQNWKIASQVPMTASKSLHLRN